MTNATSRLLGPAAAVLTVFVALACAPATPETPPSPVQAATRTAESIKGAYGDVTSVRGDDGSRVRKVVAPAPAVWDALVAAMEARKVKPTIMDRSVGRIGDTAMVVMRRWHDKPGSYYFNCGAGMTGQRADDDRLRAVLLAQLTRLPADTVAVVVHFSAFATSLTSGSTAQCTSTGRGENDLLQEVVVRLAGLIR